jgi:hypothetical protein
MSPETETKVYTKPKPKYPIALIENNIRFTRTFPYNWRRTSAEWEFYPYDRSARIKSLFDVDRSNRSIHLRTIDSLSNQHLDNTDQDFVYKILGRKANALLNDNKRNGIPEKSPGDKSYKAVEYSPYYFDFNTHSREPLRKYRIKMDPSKINNLLDYVPNMFSFDNTDDYDLTDNLKREEYTNEIDNVRQLDDWKAALPLKPPFKVVNREDKSTKYRPRINR